MSDERRPSEPGPRRERADKLLVAQGLAETREKAQALIMAGVVRRGTHRIDKAGVRIPADTVLEVHGNPLPFVGRGGLKMAGALDRFGIDPTGMVVLDIGASTGGFTDCVLQRGAKSVHALDVGRGQLHWKLRSDERVTVREGINARYLAPGDFEVDFDLATVDVSFISLRLIVPAVRTAATPGQWILLVKPQFEVGRGQVEAGGLVTDPAKHRRVLAEVLEMVQGEGLTPSGLIPSPVRGAQGNREFLLHLRPESQLPSDEQLERWIEEVTR